MKTKEQNAMFASGDAVERRRSSIIHPLEFDIVSVRVGRSGNRFEWCRAGVRVATSARRW